MIQIKNGRIHVGVKKVVGLGKYEFDHIDFMIEGDVPEDTDVIKYCGEIYDELDAELTSIKNFIKSGETSVDKSKMS